MRNLLLYIFLIIPSVSYSQEYILHDVKVILTGPYLANSYHPEPGIYVGPSSNPHSCLYGGVFFTNTSIMKEVLAIALSARISNSVVRVDYTKMPDSRCIGNSIYIK